MVNDARTSTGDEDSDGGAEPVPAATGDDTCLACRGTGRVISGLGGEPHEVVCPWCRGTGHRIPGIDAQEHPSERPADAPETTDT